jgi:hypothetical protein
MNYLKLSIGIFIFLSASRFIPHPPNFTSLLALSFYVPAFLGMRYLPVLIICFAITDYFIGFHSLVFFTWGSVLLIGFISKYFKEGILRRIFGSLFGALIFFIVTNFGVWLNGQYGYNLEGLLTCYYLAIPFFSYSLISTLFFSLIIETLYKIRSFRILGNIAK